MRTFWPCISLLVVALCGCMHTVVGGGSDSPSKHYHLWVSSHGASAKAYVEKSKKTIWVGIETRNDRNSTSLFEQRYVLIGSDIDWSTRWSSDEAVTLEFYDWGDGVSNYNNMKHLAASNRIASFSFALDRTTGNFVQKR